MLEPMTPKEKQNALVDELGMTPDEAAHMLVDMGEINSDEHRRLLSAIERERIYPPIVDRISLLSTVNKTRMVL